MKVCDYKFFLVMINRETRKQFTTGLNDLATGKTLADICAANFDVDVCLYYGQAAYSPSVKIETLKEV